MPGRPANHHASKPGARRPGPGRLELAGFALLLIAEFLLFDQVGAKHVTWVYPRWNDQIQYLTESYLGYEQLRLHGLVRALWYTVANPAAQGALHDFFAVLAFAVAGPSRSAALAINALAFLAWQGALFIGVRRAFASRAMAWTGSGLLLALGGPWMVQQGSAFDFRLDWMAAGALGVALSLALTTDGFRRRTPSLLFGAAVGVTVLIRFLTGTYLALVFLALGWWILAGADRARRLRHLLAAAAVAAVVAGPLLWRNRTTIIDYYWIGHFFGPESSIRNSHLGPGAALGWFVRMMASQQLGWFWVAWVAGGTAAIAACRLRFWRRTGPDDGPQRPHGAAVLGALFFLAPALVLLLQPEKTFVVYSALLPGAVLLVLAGWWRLLRGAPPSVRMAVAAGTLVAGAASYAAHMLRDPNPPGFEADARRVLTLSDVIFARSRAAGLTSPAVGSDQVTDFFSTPRCCA